MIDLALASSRILATADALMGEHVTDAPMFSRTVVLIGESATLQSANGRWCFLGALRLLIRVVGDLEVILPYGTDEFEREVQGVCTTNCFRAPPRIRFGAPHEIPRSAAAVLNVGSNIDVTYPWTSINSQGWVARVSSGSQSLPESVSQPNPMASFLAASLGVAEVFKRIVGVPEDRAPMFERVEFSLFELSTEFADHGPALPESLSLPNTLLVGAGAIGNGIAWLLSQLSLQGRIHIVDSQSYGDENLGTCVLLEKAEWVGRDKAMLLAAWLSSHSQLQVTGERALVGDALAGADMRALAPALIMNGLDNVPARHEVQLAWPDLLIDGGISEAGVAVVQHRLASRNRACLRCAFELRGVDHRKSQQALTGLSQDALNNPHQVLSVAHIQTAAPDKQAWLREQVRIGKTVCSVVSEAALSALGVDAPAGFRPSVPFVATAASALVVAEMVKALQFNDREFPQTFTMGSLFLGPRSAVRLNRPAKPSCVGVARRDQILAAKSRRAIPQQVASARA